MKASTRSLRTLLIGFLLPLMSASVSALAAASIAGPITNIICQIYCALRWSAGVFAGAVFVYAGVKWLMGADDPGKRKAAKDTMIHVIVGLLIVGLTITIVGGVTTVPGVADIITVPTCGACGAAP